MRDQIAARASRHALPAHSCVLETSSGVIKASDAIRDAKTMCAAAAKMEPRGCMRRTLDGLSGGATYDEAIVTGIDDTGGEQATSGAGGRVCGTGGACRLDSRC